MSRKKLDAIYAFVQRMEKEGKVGVESTASAPPVSQETHANGTSKAKEEHEIAKLKAKLERVGLIYIFTLSPAARMSRVASLLLFCSPSQYWSFLSSAPTS